MMRTNRQPQQEGSAELKRDSSVRAARIGIKPSAPVQVVKSDIEAALKRTSIADAKQISVAVNGSEVTLSGTVQSWDERYTATHSAWGTPGVRNVVDMMRLAC